MRKFALIALPFILFVASWPAGPNDFPRLSGPYLGQTPPGAAPAMFAPGIVSTCLSELNSVFSPDGREFYFCVRNNASSTLFVMKCIEGIWRRPEVLPFSGRYRDIDISLSPDGQQLFFCSNRPAGGQGDPEEDHDIWMCERRGESWSEPRHPGEAVNSSREDFYPVVSRQRTLFFSSQRAGEGTNDIYCCRWEDGRYAPAEKLGPEINTEHREFDPFIAPDESYLIFSSERPGADPSGDLYISFKNEAGAWTPARNMGPGINGRGPEFCPMISPGGKFLFFTRAVLLRGQLPEKPRCYDDYLNLHLSPDNGSTNIWWVEARIVDELKQAAGSGKVRQP